KGGRRRVRGTGHRPAPNRGGARPQPPRPVRAERLGREPHRANGFRGRNRRAGVRAGTPLRFGGFAQGHQQRAPPLHCRAQRPAGAPGAGGKCRAARRPQPDSARRRQAPHQRGLQRAGPRRGNRRQGIARQNRPAAQVCPRLLHHLWRPVREPAPGHRPLE
nr:hypothetical protein [Tanacetum cinerariifolium]